MTKSKSTLEDHSLSVTEIEEFIQDFDVPKPALMEPGTDRFCPMPEILQKNEVCGFPTIEPSLELTTDTTPIEPLVVEVASPQSISSTDSYEDVNEAKIEVSDANESEPVPKKKHSFCRHVLKIIASMFLASGMLTITLTSGYLGQGLSTVKKSYNGKEFTYDNYIFTGYCAMTSLAVLIPVLFLALFCISCFRRKKTESLKNFYFKKMTFLDNKNVSRKKFLFGTAFLGASLLGTNIFYNIAFQLMPVSINIATFQANVIFVFVLSTFILRERVDILRTTVMMLIIGGLIMLSVSGSGDGNETDGGNPILGMACSLISAGIFSLYVIGYSIFFPKGSPFDKLLVLGSSGVWISVFFLPAVLIVHFTGYQSLMGLQWQHFLFLAGIGAGMVIYYALFCLAISLGHPGFVLILSLLSIPASGFLDVVVKSESFALLTYLGFATILVGAVAQVMIEITQVYFLPIRVFIDGSYVGNELRFIRRIFYNKKKLTDEEALSDFQIYTQVEKLEHIKVQSTDTTTSTDSTSVV